MSSIELWPQQQRVFDSVKDQKRVALLCEQRTGKTYITLKLMKHRVAEFERDGESFVGLLIVLLNNKASTWATGLERFVPELEVHAELNAFRKASGHRVLLVHYKQLRGIIGKLIRFKKLNWVGVDEAHLLKDAGTKQSRDVARLHWAEWKLILTGTPMEKQPADFFGQFKFLAPEVLGTNKSQFEEEWLDWKKLDLHGPGGPRPGGPAYKEKLMLQRILKSRATFKWERLQEYIDLLSPFCDRLEKRDVGILEPVTQVHTVNMPSKLRRLYARMDRSAVVRVGSVEVLAPMAATQNMKLRQLASGFIFDEDRGLHWLDDFKLKHAIELFEGLPKPVVFFSAFVPEVEYLLEALRGLSYDVAAIYGGTPKKQRPGVWRAFQAAQLDAVVCQTAAGGVGVDLWKANHAIVTSMSYSSILWDQAKARLDARDKRVPARIHVLNTRGTIDDRLYDLLEIKGLTTKTVLKQLKKDRQNGKGTQGLQGNQGQSSPEDCAQGRSPQVRRRPARR